MLGISLEGCLTIVGLVLMGCNQHPNTTNDAKPAKYETSGDNFHKKMEGAKLGEKLEASDGEFVHRVFYSSKKDSCLVAKYTLYFGKTETESAEVTDILHFVTPMCYAKFCTLPWKP
jgi:hypothetical protein